MENKKPLLKDVPGLLENSMDIITLIQGKNSTQRRKVIYTFILDVVPLHVNQAAREKALVKCGHVTPQIVDIFVTWPYYDHATMGGGVSLSKLLNM